MQEHGPRSAGRIYRAFTLIEVLIVVAVIAVLMAILLPALSKSRDQAKRAACLANQHQIGIAIYAYSHDWNQKIPFGPKALPMVTAANLYPATGTPTSLISLLDGQPAGLGLMMREYLSRTPKVVFCPGSDQPSDADAQLAAFGISQSQSSYYYRHGSVQSSGETAAALLTWELHLKLNDLGDNRNGAKITALVIDTQFPAKGMMAFGIYPRTHHLQKHVNVLFADGHAATLPNTKDRFTINVSNPLFVMQPFGQILNVFEQADIEQ